MSTHIYLTNEERIKINEALQNLKSVMEDILVPWRWHKIFCLASQFLIEPLDKILSLFDRYPRHTETYDFLCMGLENLTKKYCLTPFEFFSFYGTFNQTGKLINLYNVNEGTKFNIGTTQLIFAVWKNQYDDAKFLLEHGIAKVPINILRIYFPKTIPLQGPEKYSQIIDLILKDGGNIVNGEFNNPTHLIDALFKSYSISEDYKRSFSQEIIESKKDVLIGRFIANFQKLLGLKPQITSKVIIKNDTLLVIGETLFKNWMGGKYNLPYHSNQVNSLLAEDCKYFALKYFPIFFGLAKKPFLETIPNEIILKISQYLPDSIYKTFNYQHTSLLDAEVNDEASVQDNIELIGSTSIL